MSQPTTHPAAPAETAPHPNSAKRVARRPHPLMLAVLIGAIAIGAMVSLVLGPRTPRLGDVSTGDPQLAADVRAVLTTDRGYGALSVARVRDGRVAYAGLGTAAGQVPTPQTPFEMGSITKPITGMLLADAVQRDEMRLEAPVSTYLPELSGTPVGSATLAELATHTAGLPGSPKALALGTALSSSANENPFGVTTSDLVQASRDTPIKDRGTYSYSNLGMSLLGHAEARAAKAADWPALATARVLRPMGMTRTSFAMTADDVPPNAAPPRRDNGWPAANWYGPAFAPAGSSTWTTAEDLARFAQGLLADRAVGMAALEPRLSTGTREIGLAWQISERDGRQITWHNGATGGYRTMLALDRDRQQAVVVLGNTTRWTDKLGLALAATESGAAITPTDRPRGPGTGTLMATLVGLLALASFGREAARARDRLTVATALLSGVAGMLVLLAYGPWSLVPGWAWGSIAG
ncbi:MAG TPA: serine hydrolase domain-containing protein, partial [Propionibacteriaceae bacterium]